MQSFLEQKEQNPNPYFPHFVILLPTHFPYINVYIIDTGFFCVYFVFDRCNFSQLRFWKNKGGENTKMFSILFFL